MCRYVQRTKSKNKTDLLGTRPDYIVHKAIPSRTHGSVAFYIWAFSLVPTSDFRLGSCSWLSCFSSPVTRPLYSTTVLLAFSTFYCISYLLYLEFDLSRGCGSDNPWST